MQRLSVAEARPFFEHPTQLRGAMLACADDLPEGVEYRACGPVCGAFHRAPWPGAWFAHYGVKPEAWGRLIEPARAVLTDFAHEADATLFIGWTPASNRAAIAFAKRLGFAVTGTLDGGAVICTEMRV
ncbi:hypothetical protein RM190_04940 [Paracoccus sp. CPCC 101403]|uniref:GNAT family N-acetyltransferase n=1 Tax=Paracoccus broussonetiae TaxID=3075834 RepID=A0ABU3EAN5_9RHOB|nr:hypothetical protein [Paracoccus sp. CPCC 101403]MDT1061195.1 hypothetical protein [Paracoccus sp. CPCC 101403]